MSDETAGTAGQDPFALARAIAVWRRRAGLTRQELADRAGMSPDQLSCLGDRPINVQQATVARLAAALGVPVRTLMASSRTRCRVRGRRRSSTVWSTCRRRRPAICSRPARSAAWR